MTKDILRIGVIGAGGPAGVVAMKSCLEAGLEPVGFERSLTIGGLWQNGPHGKVWEGMQTNISRWSCTFGDYAAPTSMTKDFLACNQVREYLDSYAQYYGVTSHIRFGQEVHTVRPAEKGWIITTASDETHVDKIIVTSGFFSKPHIPQFARQEGILHASDFKRVQDCRGKKVTVVGGSFSGYEIASELALHGIDVTHVIKKSCWQVPRYVEGLPNDLVFYTRRGRDEPKEKIDAITEQRLTEEFRQATFGNPGDVLPALKLSTTGEESNFIVITDDYLRYVEAKMLNVHVGEAVNINNGDVTLANGEKITGDIVIMATGYKSTLDFLPDDIKTKMDYRPDNMFMPLPMYDAVWPQEVKDIAFVGFYRGTFFATLDLQAQWIASVWGKKIDPPTLNDINKNVAKAQAIRDSKIKKMFPYADMVGLCDGIAKRIGAMPPLDLDDKLNEIIQYGPVIGAQYWLSRKRQIAEQIMLTLPEASYK